ncbi:hypothetical protein [Thermoflexus hugenholtzii]|uniref:Uncharacterized protein n=1 Tax=Thermoflexus hugenholtzii JAD2 TaxID=877466 RepID=A0A212QS70_9CHLR|nr:hypothetical protein [Thermoflexus hugenholtzii]SNB62422.1 hypothetical protein SAMN02746019_00005140 [Thermoflexus hugenholtzii JAD2]
MWSAWMELRRTAADAVRVFILGPQWSGVGLLADLLRMGTRGWAWVLLLLATLGTAFVFTLPGAAPQAREGLAHPAGTGLLTLWMAFLWTLLTATAGDLPAAFRLPVAIYGLFYFGLPLLSAAAPHLVLIPTLALLLFERTHPRSALAGWPGRLLWALALAQFPPHPIRPFLLSLGVKALLGIGLMSLPFWPSVRISRMARGGLLALGLTIPYLAAWGSGPAATGEGIRQMLAGVWGLSVPVWLWLGANLVEEGGRLGHFWSRRMELLHARPRLFGALPFLALALGALALPAFWPELGMALLAPLGPWGPLALYQGVWHTLRDWPLDAYLAGRTAVGVLFVLGLAGLGMRRRMEPVAFGQRYVALLIGAVAFLFAFYQAFFEVVDLELPQQWWPLLLVMVAWTWEPLKGLQELREEAEDLLEWILAAGLLLLTAVMARQLEDPEGLVRNTALWPLLGAMAWGFPYLLFTALQAARGVEGEGTVSPVRPFLLGYGLMLPLASLLPLEDRYLPPLAFWLGSLLLPPPEGSRIDRWMHGAWIGLGAVAFQVVPWILPLPVLPWAGEWLERLYHRTPLEFLSAVYFIRAAGALLAALPLAIRTGPGWRGRIGGILGALLWGLWSVRAP